MRKHSNYEHDKAGFRNERGIMKHIARLEVPRIKAGATHKIGLLVEVEAPELSTTNLVRNPQAIIFVVDRSGSMGDGRLELVKNTIGEMVGRLAPTDYLSIVSFDTEMEIHVPIRQVKDLNPQAVRRDLASLQPRGGTNIELGFAAGVMQAGLAPVGIESRIVLLSDGHANNGHQEPNAFSKLAANATEHLIKTSAIGIGEGYDERILRALADAGQGNHFAAVQLDEAVTGLQDEIDGLLERSLRDIEIKISAAKEIQGFSIKPVGYVRNVEKHATGVEARVGDLSSKETRGYAFLVSLPALRRELGTEFEFSVEVSGTSVEGETRVSQSSKLILEIAEAHGFVPPAKDEDVAAEIMAYRLTEIKEAAADAAYRGDHEGARRIIQAAQKDIEDIIRNFKRLSPRLQARILAERDELTEILNYRQVEFSKRVYESSFRSARAKSDPRKGR
jgi:Ca-activated chloride channel homolog